MRRSFVNPSSRAVPTRRLGHRPGGPAQDWFAALLLVAHLYPGVSVQSFGSAMIAALVLGLFNAVLRPLLVVLTLPVRAGVPDRAKARVLLVDDHETTRQGLRFALAQSDEFT